MEINKITLDKLTLHPDIPYETTDKSGNAGKVFGIVVTDRDHRVVFGWDHVLSLRNRAFVEGRLYSDIPAEVVVLDLTPDCVVKTGLAMVCQGKFQSMKYDRILEITGDPSTFGLGDYRDISDFFESGEKVQETIKPRGFFSIPGGIK